MVTGWSWSYQGVPAKLFVKLFGHNLLNTAETCIDLVQLSQNDRLGYKNPSDVMNHPFLSGTSVSDSSGVPLPLEVSTDVDISSFAVVKSTKSDIFDLYSK